MLVIKTIAASPGKPTIEKTGAKKEAIMAMIPQYCNKLTTKLIGKIIFNNQIMVLNALGRAKRKELYKRCKIGFIRKVLVL